MAPIAIGVPGLTIKTPARLVPPMREQQAANVNQRLLNYINLLLRDKPHYLLLFFALLLFIVALFSLLLNIEFPFQDSYHAFPVTYFFGITTITLLSSWLIYLLTARFLLSKVLMWLHIVLTILCFIFIFCYPYLSPGLGEGLAGMPRRYYDYSDFSFFDLFSYFAYPVKIAFIVMTLGQLIYLINLSLGLYKKVHART